MPTTLFSSINKFLRNSSSILTSGISSIHSTMNHEIDSTTSLLIDDNISIDRDNVLLNFESKEIIKDKIYDSLPDTDNNLTIFMTKKLNTGDSTIKINSYIYQIKNVYSIKTKDVDKTLAKFKYISFQDKILFFAGADLNNNNYLVKDENVMERYLVQNISHGSNTQKYDGIEYFDMTDYEIIPNEYKIDIEKLTVSNIYKTPNNILLKNNQQFYNFFSCTKHLYNNRINLDSNIIFSLIADCSQQSNMYQYFNASVTDYDDNLFYNITPIYNTFYTEKTINISFDSIDYLLYYNGSYNIDNKINTNILNINNNYINSGENISYTTEPYNITRLFFPITYNTNSINYNFKDIRIDVTHKNLINDSSIEDAPYENKEEMYKKILNSRQTNVYFEFSGNHYIEEI